MSCEPKDFMFPMQAEIFYPIVEQGAYGNIEKQWVLDRIVACSVNPAGMEYSEDVKPLPNITQDVLLLGRVKEDLRISSRKDAASITNIIVTNIKDRNCNPVYIETSGPRKGKSTIFEIASNEPFIGPFGSVEHYKIVLRRSENQAVDL
jgi:hypothetical protein